MHKNQFLVICLFSILLCVIAAKAFDPYVSTSQALRAYWIDKDGNAHNYTSSAKAREEIFVNMEGSRSRKVIVRFVEPGDNTLVLYTEREDTHKKGEITLYDIGDNPEPFVKNMSDEDRLELLKDIVPKKASQAPLGDSFKYSVKLEENFRPGEYKLVFFKAYYEDGGICSSIIYLIGAKEGISE